MKIAVIGTGLSAFACIKALVRRGIKPIVLDVGENLDEARRAIVSRMRALSPHEFSAADIAAISENPTLDKRGIPKKLVFGSSYVYARDHPFETIVGDVETSTSLAFGGFANAWGGAVLPIGTREFKRDWPVEPGHFERSYRNVLSWLPLAGNPGTLGSRYPLPERERGLLQLPPLLQDLDQQLNELGDQRFVHGRAQLAVHTQGEAACRRCGLCLSGCVYGSIFNPVDELVQLKKAGLIDYRPNSFIVRLKEVGRTVELEIARAGVREPSFEIVDRAFLAAGAIASTAIVLRSRRDPSQAIAFEDSQKFLLPALRLKGADAAEPGTPTLAGLFLEVSSQRLADDWLHFQVSAVNDFVTRKLGIDRNAGLRLLAGPALRRALFFWGSLPGSRSAQLMARLSGSSDRPKLEMREVGLEQAASNVIAAASDAARLLRRTGTIAATPLTKLYRPGAGNHTGASFPMRKMPTRLNETDSLGRPSGWDRLHMVDAAVFPTIPATPIALPMMANADRIASEVSFD